MFLGEKVFAGEYFKIRGKKRVVPHKILHKANGCVWILK